MKVALYHGRHVPMRGLEELVQSCEFLHKDVTLVLRGYGTIEAELRELGKPFTNCKFAPPVPMEKLTEVASSADVGVIPYIPVNINNYFTSPNKLFEYIGAGLAVVGSDVPFLRQIILENEIGYVFNPRDPQSIADAINKATRKENLAHLRANVQRIKHKYSWQAEQKKLLAIYAQAK